MDRDDVRMTDAEREESERLAAEQQGAILPTDEGVADGVLGLIDGAFSVIATVDVLTDVAGVLPKVASESMEVIGNIGEALGDVLDFDF
jgi:hypothetical protein